MENIQNSSPKVFEPQKGKEMQFQARIKGYFEPLTGSSKLR